MGSRIALADQLARPRIQVLLGVTYRLLERGRCRVVEDLHARARAFDDLDAVEARSGRRVGNTLAGSAELARRQRVIADLVVSSRLGRRYELLRAIITHEVTEVGIAERGSTDPFLLLFYPAADFK